MLIGACQKCDALNVGTSAECIKCGVLFSKVPLRKIEDNYLNSIKLQSKLDSIKAQNNILETELNRIKIKNNSLETEINSIKAQNNILEKEYELISNAKQLLYELKFTNALSIIDNIEYLNNYKSILLGNIESNISLEKILRNYRNKEILVNSGNGKNSSKYVIASVSADLVTLKKNNSFIHIPYDTIYSITEINNNEEANTKEIYSKTFNVIVTLKSTVVNNYIENTNRGGGVGVGVGVLLPLPNFGE